MQKVATSLAVAAALNRAPETYHYLPNPAKCAIEYLGNQDYGKRTIEKLDKYIDHYFTVQGQECDLHTRYSCHYIAIKRYQLEGADAEGSLYVPGVLGEGVGPQVA